MKAKSSKNMLTQQLQLFYLVIILGISCIACYFAYQQRRGELLSSMDMALLYVENEYRSITENFWDVYIPIYQKSRLGEETMYHYFTQTDPLSPLDRSELKDLLAQMALRDDRIRWVAVVNTSRDSNYYYSPSTDLLNIIPEDFPYWEELHQKEQLLETYGEKGTDFCGYNTIVMAGGDSMGDPHSAIAVGYDTTDLRNICENNQIVPSIQFFMALDDGEIFTSHGQALPLNESLSAGEHGIVSYNGARYYVHMSDYTMRNSRIYYSIDNAELLRLSHKNTPLILLLVVIVAVLSGVVYSLTICSVRREVSILRTGLEKIGENQLDYRINTRFRQGDFQQIADAINVMAQSLKENIDRVYYYKLRQREAEMQELQSKFNPHFLYNSLEMFRARCYQNGDEETADLIAQTAAIFRGFINPRTFIPIQEELAFSKRYLSLFRARYGETLQILYDFDTEVLQYGIIRNVFQPLIENYFVHGIDTSKKDNYIRFRGCIGSEDTILIVVEDNGLGMEPDKLQELNVSMEKPIVTEGESYGLKNLNQRLRLFYGANCGLRLHNNSSGGLTQELVVGRWTVEDAKTKVPDSASFS